MCVGGGGVEGGESSKDDFALVSVFHHGTVIHIDYRKSHLARFARKKCINVSKNKLYFCELSFSLI